MKILRHFLLLWILIRLISSTLLENDYINYDLPKNYFYKIGGQTELTADINLKLLYKQNRSSDEIFRNAYFELYACPILAGCEQVFETVEQTIKMYQNVWIDPDLNTSVEYDKHIHLCNKEVIRTIDQVNSTDEINFQAKICQKDFYEKTLIFTKVIMTFLNKNFTKITYIDKLSLGQVNDTNNLNFSFLGDKMAKPLVELHMQQNSFFRLSCLSGFGGPHCTFECSAKQPCSFRKIGNVYQEECTKNYNVIPKTRMYSNMEACGASIRKKVTIFQCSPDQGIELLLTKLNGTSNYSSDNWHRISNATKFQQGDLIRCESHSKSAHKFNLKLFQFTGPDHISDKSIGNFSKIENQTYSPWIKLNDELCPGIYTMVCFAKNSTIFPGYYRFFTIELIGTVSKLLIPSFIPVTGALVSCGSCDRNLPRNSPAKYEIIINQVRKHDNIEIQRTPNHYALLPNSLECMNNYTLICKSINTTSGKSQIARANFILAKTAAGTNPVSSGKCNIVDRETSYSAYYNLNKGYFTFPKLLLQTLDTSFYTLLLEVIKWSGLALIYLLISTKGVKIFRKFNQPNYILPMYHRIKSIVSRDLNTTRSVSTHVTNKIFLYEDFED